MLEFSGQFSKQQLQQFLRFTVFHRLFKTSLTVFNSSDDILETRALQASNFKANDVIIGFFNPKSSHDEISLKFNFFD